MNIEECLSGLKGCFAKAVGLKEFRRFKSCLFWDFRKRSIIGNAVALKATGLIALGGSSPSASDNWRIYES
jgi:hypothetical protein